MRPSELRGACAIRGCRALWTFVPRCGGGPFVDVDHVSETASGSSVCITRRFAGELARASEEGRYDWSDEQTAAILAWVQTLHRMPLEEIP